MCELKWQETSVKVASAGRPCSCQVLVMWRSCPCNNILAPFFSGSIALIIRATSRPVVVAESLKSKQLPSRPITWSSTASLSPMGSMAWFAFVCVGFCFLGKTSSCHSYQWAVVTMWHVTESGIGTFPDLSYLTLMKLLLRKHGHELLARSELAASWHPPSCLPVLNGFSLGSNSDPPRHPESSPLDVWTPEAFSLLQQPAGMLLLIFSLTIFPPACLPPLCVGVSPSLSLHPYMHPPSLAPINQHPAVCLFLPLPHMNGETGQYC